MAELESSAEIAAVRDVTSAEVAEAIGRDPRTVRGYINANPERFGARKERRSGVETWILPATMIEEIRRGMKPNRKRAAAATPISTLSDTELTAELPRQTAEGVQVSPQNIAPEVVALLRERIADKEAEIQRMAAAMEQTRANEAAALAELSAAREAFTAEIAAVRREGSVMMAAVSSGRINLLPAQSQVTPSTPAPSTDAISDTHSLRPPQTMPSSPNEAQDGQKPGFFEKVKRFFTGG